MGNALWKWGGKKVEEGFAIKEKNGEGLGNQEKP